MIGLCSWDEHGLESDRSCFFCERKQKATYCLFQNMSSQFLILIIILWSKRYRECHNSLQEMCVRNSSFYPNISSDHCPVWNAGRISWIDTNPNYRCSIGLPSLLILIVFRLRVRVESLPSSRYGPGRQLKWSSLSCIVAMVTTIVLQQKGSGIKCQSGLLLQGICDVLHVHA